MRSISISELGTDSITIYENAAVFVGILDYRDFNALNKWDLSNKAGIYILITNNGAGYIGQAVGQSLKTRIPQHREDWMKSVTKVLFFGRKNDEFSKDQSDFLEAKLMKDYKENSNFEILNKTNGNTSPIGFNAQLAAEELYKTFFDILENVANLNLFAEEKEIAEENSADCYVKFNGKILTDKSPKRLYVKFVKDLFADGKYNERLQDFIVDDKATSKNNLGREVNIFPVA